MTEVRVASVSDVPPGTGRTVFAAERAIALFNVAGTFYALDGTCLHRGGPIGDGDLEGTIVTCPWHGWQYEVTSGEHTFDRTIGLRRYAVRVEGDDILIEP